LLKTHLLAYKTCFCCRKSSAVAFGARARRKLKQDY